MPVTYRQEEGSMATTTIIGSGRTKTVHTLPPASNPRPSHPRQQEDLADVGYQTEDGAGSSVLRPAVPVQMLRRFSRLAHIREILSDGTLRSQISKNGQ